MLELDREKNCYRHNKTGKLLNMLSPSKFHYCTAVENKTGRNLKYTPEKARAIEIK